MINYNSMANYIYDFDGNLYIIGSNDNFQAGNRNRNNVKPMTCIMKDKSMGIKKIITDSFSIVIHHGEKLIYFGQNTKKIFGFKKTFIDAPLSYSNKKVKDVYCGYNYTIIYTNELSLFGIGLNDKGQLGLPNDGGRVNKFTKIMINVKIKKMICGGFHTIVYSVDGEIIVFGCNEYINCSLKM